MIFTQFFHAPGKVFSELRANDWATPLGVAVMFSAVSAILMLNAIGIEVITHKLQEMGHRDVTEFPLGQAVAAASVLVVLKVLVYASVIFWVLRLKQELTNYGIVLAICSYGACIDEMLTFLINFGVWLYHRIIHVPLADVKRIRTDAAVFLNNATTHRSLYDFARSLNLLDIIFIVVVGFGLSKAVPKIGFAQGILVATIPLAGWMLLNVRWK
jgi:hypothetical protein